MHGAGIDGAIVQCRGAGRPRLCAVFEMGVCAVDLRAPAVVKGPVSSVCQPVGRCARRKKRLGVRVHECGETSV